MTTQLFRKIFRIGFFLSALVFSASVLADTPELIRALQSGEHIALMRHSIAPGTGDRNTLFEEISSGIFVRGVNGLHSGVNPVSGDFSVGAYGHKIRDGALAEPFSEATIASTLQRMLLDVVAIGGDFEFLPGGSGMASIAIEDIALSGM